MSRFRGFITGSIAAITLALSVESSPAQLVVFDPNNYAQNVLTAARTLQQINNQIVSLQNQAQMLINQAKNLATLPFSSLLQLEQSICEPSSFSPRPSASLMTLGRSTAHFRRPMRQRHPAYRIKR